MTNSKTPSAATQHPIRHVFLGNLERLGNKLPNPAILFSYFISFTGRHFI